ncbi:FMN-dependent dehydrogenase-domain-containing protein [Aspergillus karnatakaensis]|uniref:FMN-dependent alpha-hydroxy acid dehydrogenase n=1 Tax=Aspergillus karnatakaensis TaxID=1810916 RepID=UPI003CCD1A93
MGVNTLDSPMLSVQDVTSHNTPDDCWVVIKNEVWDLTGFVNEHPGGPSVILKYAGKDATEPFLEIHPISIIRENISTEHFKGRLDTATITPEWTNPPVKSQLAEGSKPLLHSLINSYDFERAAAISAPKKAYTFYSTADTDCWTRDANESMLKRIWFRPRVMKDVTNVNTSTTMLGIPISLPIFICPTGVARLIHPDAEKGLARAAKSTGILEIISTNSGHPLPEIISSAPNHPFAFQLYLNRDKSKSRELLLKAESLGCTAIFLTVDAAGRGKRESDERLKTDDILIHPVTGQPIKTEGGLTRVMGSFIDQGMTWKDIAWIRSVTKLPLVLKGITTAEDARIAMRYGVEGILLSNHGGRNLDYSPPAILLLLEMHRNCPEVFEKMEVYVDGGFRRGSDIVKALCLGAKAVGIGRSFLYALHYGTEGVEHLIQILKSEMESVMKLIGITDLSQVYPGLVNTADVDHLVPDGADHPYIKWRARARANL